MSKRRVVPLLVALVVAPAVMNAQVFLFVGGGLTSSRKKNNHPA